MSYLLDTNVLLRTINPQEPMHQTTITALNILNGDRDELIVSSQNLIELWNVCTRPLNKNGFGLTPEETKEEIEIIKVFFNFVPDVETIYSEWERLVTNYKVMGSKVHDTRLVAFMLTHQIDRILTFNVKDFQRFKNEIRVVHPQQIIDRNTIN